MAIANKGIGFASLGVTLAMLCVVSPVQAKPYEVRCQEPVPTFTLGEKSNPTKAQVTTLCACIWQSLGTWEREASAKIARGRESEVSQMHLRAFPARFGGALEKCGGMRL